MFLYELIGLCEFGIKNFRIFKDEKFLLEVQKSGLCDLESVINSDTSVKKYNIQKITEPKSNEEVVTMFIYI